MIHRPDWTVAKQTLPINLGGNVHYDYFLHKQVSEIVANSDLHDYPNEHVLYEAISDYYSTPIENIAIGHGATEVLERLVKIHRDRKFYIVSPTFEMVEVYCRIYNVEYQLINDWEIMRINDPEAVLYVATPNGQTGVWIDPNDIIHRSFHTIILDMVYHEFCPDPNVYLSMPLDRNVVTIHSISKTLGLAGLRVGWAIGNKDVIAQLQQIRSNYITNTAAAVVVPAVIHLTREVVERMLDTKQLLESSYDCNSCYGNFVLFKQRNALTDKYGYRATSGGYRMALMDMRTLNG